MIIIKLLMSIIYVQFQYRVTSYVYNCMRIPYYTYIQVMCNST